MYFIILQEARLKTKTNKQGPIALGPETNGVCHCSQVLRELSLQSQLSSHRALLSPTQGSFTLYCRPPAVPCQERSCWGLPSLLALHSLLQHIHAAVTVTSASLSQSA